MANARDHHPSPHQSECNENIIFTRYEQLWHYWNPKNTRIRVVFSAEDTASVPTPIVMVADYSQKQKSADTDKDKLT